MILIMMNMYLFGNSAPTLNLLIASEGPGNASGLIVRALSTSVASFMPFMQEVTLASEESFDLSSADQVSRDGVSSA